MKRFYTDSGIEVPAVTEEQMREIDRIAMEETGPNLYQMMENAGRSLSLLAMEVLGREWNKANVVVLAGTGGNGGGGICASRHLANRGVKVKLCISNPDGLTDVPAHQRKVFQATAGEEVNLESLPEKDVDLILDALIGYSLRSAPRGVVKELIQWANGTGVHILSLDVPSGVDATTGATPGEFIKPRWALTLALPKTGLLPERTGDLYLADLGIPERTYTSMGLNYISPFGDRYYAPLYCRK
jgi:NAD(P)H-hydrate epimerase